VAKLDVQNRVLDLLDQVTGRPVVRETIPLWLVRPGRAEAGPLWEPVQKIYAGLTGMILPDVMRPVERRKVDGVFTDADGLSRVVEVDEDQHFSAHRAATFEHYPADAPVAFDPDQWKERSLSGIKLRGGGYARPCPPLFPEPGGRHLQRAYRDALSDLIPPVHGWAPTLRIGEFEVAGWLEAPDAVHQMRRLLHEKGFR